MTDRRRIEYVTTMDSKGFQSGASGLMGSLQNIGSKFGLTEGFINGAVKSLGFFGAAIGAEKVLSWVRGGLDLAASAAEVDSKFQAVYGSAGDLETRLEEWGDKAGVTESKAKDLAGTMGNLALAQGLSRDATIELVSKTADLAGDLASFNDANPEEVFFDLNKAILTTEREGMKKYGISLNENEIKQRALELALADGRSEFSKADKALATFQLASEQAGKAVGDLDRTQDSTKNQAREFRASIEELQTAVGESLLPALQDLVTFGNNYVVPTLDALVKGTDDSSSSWQVMVDKSSSIVSWFLDPVGQSLGFLNEKVLGVNKSLGDLPAASQGYGDAIHNIGDPLSIVTDKAWGTKKAMDELVAVMAARFPVPQTAATQDELAALAGKIIAAKREFIQLRDIMAGGLTSPGKTAADSQSVWNQINGNIYG